MAEDNGTQPLAPALPKCPVCDAQPLIFAENLMQTNGGLTVGMLWCAKCGYILSAQILAMQKPLSLGDLTSNLQHIRGRAQ